MRDARDPFVRQRLALVEDGTALVLRVHAVGHGRVDVQVQVERRAEALGVDQGAALGRRARSEEGLEAGGGGAVEDGLLGLAAPATGRAFRSRGIEVGLMLQVTYGRDGKLLREKTVQIRHGELNELTVP